ncbi:BppU family phage baseplate upper protein [Listeria booriae]|uniref:BppU family phage baseplate upper protein n=1 Tax=Listeria booriae TaxID=1552123 RepID=UPI001624E634|nr:BppU family phage baseplate upper protein [Listeria booriae]MBC2163411.1 BppU family phage baseplate upper protein [Listeria booriae]
MAGLRVIEAILDINTKSWDIPKIEAIQGDINSLTLRVTLEASGVVVPIVGWRANFVAFPDNVHIVSDPVINFTDAANGIFEYTFVKQAFAVPGVIDNARFVLIKEDGSQLSGMPRFTYEVEEDPSQGKVEIDDFIGDFAALQTKITGLQNQLNSLQTQLTDMNVVKRTGDAMTGNLTFDVAAERLIRGFNYATNTAGAGIFFNQGAFGFSDWTNNFRFATYSIASKKMNFLINSLTIDGKSVANTTDSVQKAGDSTVVGIISATDFKVGSQSVKDSLADTGWKDLPLKSGFIADGSTPQYRKIGSKVIYRGGVGRTAGAKGVFATAPVGFRTSDPYLEGFSQGQRTSADGASSLVYAKLNGDMEIVSATNTSTIWLSGIYYYVD